MPEIGDLTCDTTCPAGCRKGGGGGLGIPGANHPVHGCDGVATGMAGAPHEVHPLLDFGADPGIALV